MQAKVRAKNAKRTVSLNCSNSSFSNPPVLRTNSSSFLNYPGPPKLFSAYDRASLKTSSLSTSDSNEHCTTHQLLLLQDSDDISDIDSSDLHLRMSLLWSHPHVRISTSLLDSHVYLFSLQRLLGLLSSEAGQKMKSLREEVVPFMVKCSWMVGLREKAGWTDQASNVTSFPEQPSFWNTKSNKDNVANHLRSSTFVDSELLQVGSSIRPALDEIDSRSSPLFSPGRSRLLSPSAHPEAGGRAASLLKQTRASAKIAANQTRVNALVFRLSTERKHPVDPSVSIEELRERREDAKFEPFIARANTVPTYLECNRYVSLSALFLYSFVTRSSSHFPSRRRDAHSYCAA